MNELALDLTGRPTSEVDPPLLDFLKTTINSFVKWDLIRFFHDNAETTDTAVSVAHRAGRTPERIASGLTELAQAGVLEHGHLADTAVYSLTSDPEIRTLLKRCVGASGDRYFRVRAIYHIIGGTVR